MRRRQWSVARGAAGAGFRRPGYSRTTGGMISRAASAVSSPRASSPRARRLALAVLFAGVIALGGSGVWVKVSEIGPSATGFYRMAFALPVFWMWAALAPRGEAGDARAGPARWRAGPAGRLDYALLVAAGLMFAGDIVTWHWALQYTSVANASLLGNLAAIFVTFGAWALLGERVTPVYLVGLAVAIAGAAVLMGDSLSLSRTNFYGDALSLVTALFYAAYLLILARLRRHLSTATIMSWSTAVTALAILPVAMVSGESLVAPTWAGWAILVGFALVSQAGGQGMVAYALAHLPAGFSSVAMLVQPVAAAIIAWAVIGEALGPWQAAGGAIVLGGILLARRGSRDV